MKKQKQGKSKPLDVGRSEDDMSAKGKARVNTRIVPNKRPSPTPKSDKAVRG